MDNYLLRGPFTDYSIRNDRTAPNGRRGSAHLAPNPLTSRVSHSRGSGVTGTDNLRSRGRANAVAGGRGRTNVSRGQGRGTTGLSRPLGMGISSGVPGSAGVSGNIRGSSGSQRSGQRGGGRGGRAAGPSRPNGTTRGSSSTRSQHRGAAGPRPNGNSGSSVQPAAASARHHGNRGSSTSNRGQRGAGGSYRGGRGGRALTSISNRGGHGVRQDQRSSHPFTLDRLCDFLDNSESGVIRCIHEDLEGWKSLLKDDSRVEDRSVGLGGTVSVRRPSPQSSDDKLSIIVYILGEKVCSTKTTLLRTAQTEILEASVICQVFMKNIMAKFVSLNMNGPTAGQHVTTLSRVPWNLVRFLQCLAKIARFMSETTMKTRAVSFVTELYSGLIGVFGAWQMMGRALSSELEAMKKDFSDLYNEKEAWLMVINQEKQQRRMCLKGLREAEVEKVHQDLMAVENIRCIPIVPDALELLSAEIPFIRPLKVAGAYKDASTYLDIHFRLLREDLVRPLREGIQEYLESRASNFRGKRLKSNLRLYPDVELLGSSDVKGVRVQYVQLSPKQWKKVQWDKSKRLLNGNLLVLTPNDFRTALFAMVHIRDNNELKKKGVFGITWHTSSMFADFRQWDTFLMVESEVYFEAYRHTLEILQTLPLDSFRMCKFIIEVSTEVGAPKYLQQPSITMEIGNRRIPPLDLNKWPTATQLKLDVRQYAAYQACLTKEFVIVQGPPGTGKTFLGLQVVKTLLKNQKLWHCPSGSSTTKPKSRIDEGDLGGPILVVCYTNHALDQFLEGIVSVFSELKQPANMNMVRIGGNSSSEIMKALTLYERRKIWSNKRRWCTEVYEERKANSKLRRLEDDYAYATIELQYLKRFSGVVMLKDLRFQDELLKLNSELPGIQKWIKFCSNLDYFGYDPSVFTRPLKNVVELINQRFDVQAESEDRLTPSFAKSPAPEDHNAIVDDESDYNEDYDYNELMQRRLIDEDYDDDITDVPTKLDTALDICERPLADARRLLADQEYNLSVFRKFNPRPEDPTLELALEQHDQDTEVADYQALVELKKAQQSWDTELANCQIWMKKARQNVSSLMAFEKYVSRIIELKGKNMLRGLEIGWNDFSHVTHYRQLTEKQRWGIYFLLRQKAIDIGSSTLWKKREAARIARDHWLDARNEMDGKLLNESLVVGMTTTGAAKYYNLLKKAQSKIVIVEEAAEVLESHIVTCITAACQHFILIGDHQQLRPSNSVYELSKKFNLDISLFERMVKNNFNCLKLEVQHRMRPEIADLVVGTIYEQLKNAPKVHEYPPVKGVTSNVFFFSHDHAEDGVTDSKSKSNKFEAAFLIAFCRYLIDQDYSPSQITILTTYSGQMLLMKKLQRENDIPWEVRITTVDNYQGEENDIILLSLVRSNEAQNIGFLKTDNRVCVALSRAKHGLFIIGNMDQLSQKSKTWEAIRQKLLKRGEIGTSLRIRCEVHSTTNEITTPSQFEELAPQGGCSKYCLTPLKCGHICSFICHPYDREHTHYKCPQPCTKSCVRNHPCKAQCYQKCPDCADKLRKLFPDCGHETFVPCYLFDTPLQCITLVIKELACDHSADMACCMDPKEYKCQTKVVKELPCGHEKKVLCCNKDDYVSCQVMMEKTLKCGHSQMEPCHVAIANVKCRTEVNVQFPNCKHKKTQKCHLPKPRTCSSPCSALLDCGHVCAKTCHAGKDPKHLQYKCQLSCTKEMLCGHKCRKKCSEDCGACEILKTRYCGHTILVKCSEPVSGDCMNPFPGKFKSPCGHEVTIPCSKRFEVSRLKLEEYCTTSGCNFRVPEIDSIDIEGSHQFLLDDALVTELDRLSL